ncbi:hypothetical protein BDZ45DRAFT_743281 [Acephala macrosclerotiorum]|nr:hypothetical protein BDZ45DRAFT_743281 [Acephala macrosclerotiorum]
MNLVAVTQEEVKFFLHNNSIAERQHKGAQIYHSTAYFGSWGIRISRKVSWRSNDTEKNRQGLSTLHALHLCTDMQPFKDRHTRELRIRRDSIIRRPMKNKDKGSTFWQTVQHTMVPPKALAPSNGSSSHNKMFLPLPMVELNALLRKLLLAANIPSSTPKA